MSLITFRTILILIGLVVAALIFYGIFENRNEKAKNFTYCTGVFLMVLTLLITVLWIVKGLAGTVEYVWNAGKQGQVKVTQPEQPSNPVPSSSVSEAPPPTTSTAGVATEVRKAKELREFCRKFFRETGRAGVLSFHDSDRVIVGPEWPAISYQGKVQAASLLRACGVSGVTMYDYYSGKEVGYLSSDGEYIPK